MKKRKSRRNDRRDPSQGHRPARKVPRVSATAIKGFIRRGASLCWMVWR